MVSLHKEETECQENVNVNFHGSFSSCIFMVPSVSDHSYEKHSETMYECTLFSGMKAVWCMIRI